MADLNLVAHSLVLFVITFVGVILACRVFPYEITIVRKAGASMCFALLNGIPIPLPFLDIIVPALGLYMCLVDNYYDRSTVNKVFVFTFSFAIVSTVVLYSLSM